MEENWLYLLYNLITNLKQEIMTSRLEVVFTVWAIGLATISVVGMVYAWVQVVVGNTGGIAI